MEQSSSEFPPETRRVLQVEIWRLRGGVNRSNTSHALPRKAIQVAEVPQALAPQALAPEAMAGRGHI